MNRSMLHFFSLNLGHFIDHFFLLIFATVAALALTQEWGLGYAQLIAYATPGFVAFGALAIPAGWLADNWSREKMMAIYFLGMGLSALGLGLAETPLQLGVGLTLLGCFAAIYHPVGLAMVVHNRAQKGMALAVNGVYGNLGVACAALATGAIIDWLGWRMAFVLPGAAAMVIGAAYCFLLYRSEPGQLYPAPGGAGAKASEDPMVGLGVQARVLAVVLVTVIVGGLVFQSTTFALPKVFDERLAELGHGASGIGALVFAVMLVASFAQLLVGHLLDRMSLRRLLGAILLSQLVLFALAAQAVGLGAVVLAALYMQLVFGQIPVNDFMIGRVVRQSWISRAFAFRSAITFVVMAVTIPLIAWMHHQHGFAGLYAMLATISAIAFASIFGLPRIAALNMRAKA